MERVILVGVETQKNQANFFDSMKELESLTKTAEGEVVATLVQKRQSFDAKGIIGTGKIDELRQLIERYEAETVIFNQELSPRQGQYLAEALAIKVIDRIQLILDIFAMRAKSSVGKLQVELAQLNYLLPRLSGQGTALSRLGGGIGTRGPGETKLESDRRHIREKILIVKRELDRVSLQRQVARKKRQESSTYQIGLIGYTNAGKSTILNLLTASDTYEENQLFATLDPLTKRWAFPQGFEVTVTDTVGFIQDLPTQLIEAFKSTLEESRNMDLLLHVVDASSPQRLQQESTVLDLLKTLDLDHIPRLTVYNKADKLNGALFTPTLFPSCVISARQTDGREILVQAVKTRMLEELIPYELLVKPSEGQLLSKLRTQTLVISDEFNEKKEVYDVRGFAKDNSAFIKGDDRENDME